MVGLVDCRKFHHKAHASSRGLANTWHSAFLKEGLADSVSLQSLLKWSLSCNTHRRQLLACQLVRDIGNKIDAMIVKIGTGATLAGFTYVQHDECSDVYLDRITTGYWQGCGELITDYPLFLSAAPDKSRVGSVGMMTSPVCIPGNFCAYACPQDTGRNLVYKGGISVGSPGVTRDFRALCHPPSARIGSPKYRILRVF